MPDHAEVMRVHRKHEHDKAELQGRHMKAHADLNAKHLSERHAMHRRHEEERMAEAGRGEAAVAGATPGGDGGAIGGAGEVPQAAASPA